MVILRIHVTKPKSAKPNKLQSKANKIIDPTILTRPMLLLIWSSYSRGGSRVKTHLTTAAMAWYPTDEATCTKQMKRTRVPQAFRYAMFG